MCNFYQDQTDKLRDLERDWNRLAAFNTFPHSGVGQSYENLAAGRRSWQSNGDGRDILSSKALCSWPHSVLKPPPSPSGSPDPRPQLGQDQQETCLPASHEEPLGRLHRGWAELAGAPPEDGDTDLPAPYSSHMRWAPPPGIRQGLRSCGTTGSTRPAAGEDSLEAPEEALCKAACPAYNFIPGEAAADPLEPPLFCSADSFPKQGLSWDACADTRNSEEHLQKMRLCLQQAKCALKSIKVAQPSTSDFPSGPTPSESGSEGQDDCILYIHRRACPGACQAQTMPSRHWHFGGKFRMIPARTLGPVLRGHKAI
ncbi:hypothetical protein WJX84_009677 [Apatococcus fuscideae]|uniref:Uncharacterized protein n=1 Tax=Apatococcus fuscideae TaxID=2026836 RepID=A0AAW1TF90_9CHLO